MSELLPTYPPRLTGGYYLRNGREKLDNCLLFDWFSCTLSLDGEYFHEYGDDLSTGQVFIDLLGLDSVYFQVAGGVRGYSKRLWFDGVNIHLPGANQPTVWLEMSGGGCRAFETYGTGNWEQLFDFALKYCHITRLDVSFDDHSGILDMTTLLHDTFIVPSYVSKCFKHKLVLDADDRSGGSSITIYHGSDQSEIKVRIYDKAAELRKLDHWVRVEIEFHRDRASAFIELLYSNMSIGQAWSGVLLNYLRYVEPDEFDINRWRWPLKSYWSELVGSSEPICLYVGPGVEYNMQRLDDFIFSQAGNSIRTYIEVFGIERFLVRLKESQPLVTPDKYKMLIEKYKRYEK